MEGLSRFLVYVLGHRPDEFGLVPDKEGFVAYKDLIQALGEEEGWRYVRRSHIQEILLGNDRALFQEENDRIRSMDRRWKIGAAHPAPSLPGILFTAIRRRAHPVVMEKGLKGSEDRPLALSANRDMALRIGRRRNQDPVVLEVSAASAQGKGILFYSFGDLVLTHDIPARFIAGPPVPKEVAEARKEKDTSAKKPVKATTMPTPGTFVLDPSRDPDRLRQSKGRKRKGWKEAARKMRRQHP